MRPPILRCRLLLAACCVITQVSEVTSEVTIGTAAVFLRGEEPAVTVNPHAAVTAPSEATCALRCVAQQPWFCRTMTYHADGGVCLMFSSCPDLPPLQDVDTSSARVRYHRQQPDCPDTCECPAGFSRCAGHCLLSLDDWVDYHTAETLCATHGAHLVVPRSETELQCVRRMANTTEKKQVWLGVSDLEEEGRFRGEDGCGPLTIPNSWWADGQPNGGAAANYVASTETGWFDSDPENVKHPLCQLNGCYRPHCLD